MPIRANNNHPWRRDAGHARRDHRCLEPADCAVRKRLKESVRWSRSIQPRSSTRSRIPAWRSARAGIAIDWAGSPVEISRPSPRRVTSVRLANQSNTRAVAKSTRGNHQYGIFVKSMRLWSRCKGLSIPAILPQSPSSKARSLRRKQSGQPCPAALAPFRPVARAGRLQPGPTNPAHCPAGSKGGRGLRRTGRDAKAGGEALLPPPAFLRLGSPAGSTRTVRCAAQTG
jgi:hypothetical protein